jgi:hypothetical protein
VDNKAVTIASWFYRTGDEDFINNTVIDGNGLTVLNVGSNADGTQIIGLTIQNGNNGIKCASQITIESNYIIGNADGIDYENGGGDCNDNYVADNTDDGIDLDGPTAVVIMDNTIENNSDDGIEIRLHAYAGAVLNIIIQDNDISGNQEDGIQLIDYPDVSDRIFRIERNVFVANAMAALGLMANGNTVEDFSGAPIPEQILLINNTFIENAYGVTGGANLVALNNIFSNIQNSALKNLTADSIASFNLFWHNGLDYEQSNINPQTSIFEDPQLASNYSLKSTSIAIDAGTPYFNWQGEEILNMAESEYSGLAPDMGAFEYDADVVTTSGSSGGGTCFISSISF